MTKPLTTLLAASMLAVGLAACADQPYHNDRAYYNNGGATEYGRVSSIELIGTDGGDLIGTAIDTGWCT